MMQLVFKANTSLDVSSQETHKQFKGPTACRNSRQAIFSTIRNYDYYIYATIFYFLLNPVMQTTGVFSKHHFLEKQTIFVIYYVPDQSGSCSKSPRQYKQTH